MEKKKEKRDEREVTSLEVTLTEADGTAGDATSEAAPEAVDAKAAAVAEIRDPMEQELVASDEEPEAEAEKDEAVPDEVVMKLEKMFGEFPKTFAYLKERSEMPGGDDLETFAAKADGYAKGFDCMPAEVDDTFGMLFRIGEACAGREKFSLEMFEMLLKGRCHERLRGAAEHEAEIRGRNVNIVEKLRKLQESDGVPRLNGTAGRRLGNSRGIFSLAEGAR